MRIRGRSVPGVPLHVTSSGYTRVVLVPTSMIDDNNDRSNCSFEPFYRNRLSFTGFLHPLVALGSVESLRGLLY